MTSTINQETWKLLEQGNEIIVRQQKELKAAETRQERHVSRLQKVEKDVVLTSDKPLVKSSLAKPQLASPKTSFGGFQQEPGLIAIMGMVLALQAKTNSNFWSTLWKQASQAMMMQVKFAPIIGDAIKSSYNAAAQATSLEAQKAYTTGVVNTVGFVGSLATGVFMEIKAPTEELSTEDDTAVEEEGTAEDEVNTGTSTEEQTQELDRETSTGINNQSRNSESTGESFSRSMKSKLKWMKRGSTLLNGVLGKTIAASQAANMLSQGISSLQTANYDNKKATQQQLEGQAQAVSKEAEQYAQFYGQSFSRQENLREGSSQNIDQAMNILKSAADSITQTVTAMFRG